MSLQDNIAAERAEMEAQRATGRVPLNEAAAEALLKREMANASQESVPTRHRLEGNRVPFGDDEQKLYHPPIPGYTLRWFNDTPGRIGRAIRAGWSHVEDPDRSNNPMQRVVDRTERGGGLQAYLMKTPTAWYEEDQAAQQAKVAAKLDDIKRGRTEAGAGSNQYIPTQGIKIVSSERR